MTEIKFNDLDTYAIDHLGAVHLLRKTFWGVREGYDSPLSE